MYTKIVFTNNSQNSKEWREFSCYVNFVTLCIVDRLCKIATQILNIHFTEISQFRDTTNNMMLDMYISNISYKKKLYMFLIKKNYYDDNSIIKIMIYICDYVDIIIKKIGIG